MFKRLYYYYCAYALKMITTGKTFFKTLNAALYHAQKEVYVSTFKIDLPQGSEFMPLKKTISLLTRQAQKGLDVRIICPGFPQKTTIARQNFPALRRLALAGVKVLSRTGYGTLHAKLFIIDHQILAIGSHNLSKGSCTRNWEMSLFTFEKHLVDDATRYFLTIWDNSKF